MFGGGGSAQASNTYMPVGKDQYLLMDTGKVIHATEVDANGNPKTAKSIQKQLQNDYGASLIPGTKRYQDASGIGSLGEDNTLSTGSLLALSDKVGG